MKTITITHKNITYRIGYISILLALVSMVHLSCEEFITIAPPTTEIVGATVYTDDASALAAVSGIYSDLIDVQFGLANGGPTLFGGLSSDEFINYSTDHLQFFEHSLVPNNSNVIGLWNEGYARIFAANAAIHGLEQSTEVSENLRNQLIGESLFLRAFLHFYLVNLYGDVPYITTTDFKINTSVSRAPTEQVYDHIILDLTHAVEYLAADYFFSNEERTRPNQAAANAMLARVHLYKEDWTNAEKYATIVIENPTYKLEIDLNNVFLPNGTEAIWQLIPFENRNTNEGLNFILTATPGLVSLRSELINSLEEGDKRLDSWIESFFDGTTTYYYPYKYKVQTSLTTMEYYMVLRLAEQFLIRSEARVKQGNIEGAQDDLNLIRERAGLNSFLESNETTLLLAIEQERKIELFAEWGHRWFDLKRTNRADIVLGNLKTNWQPTDVLYPIPQDQINNSEVEFPQNSGY